MRRLSSKSEEYSVVPYAFYEESPNWAVRYFHKMPHISTPHFREEGRECLIHLCCCVGYFPFALPDPLSSSLSQLLCSQGLTLVEASVGLHCFLAKRATRSGCLFSQPPPSWARNCQWLLLPPRTSVPGRRSLPTPAGFLGDLVADSTCLFRPCCCCAPLLQSLSSFTIPYRFLLTLLYIFLWLNLFSNPSLGLTVASCREAD